MSKLNEHELISIDQVKVLIREAKQEVYREISDSLISAGERDLYDYSGIEEQVAKAGCAMAGERISWLVRS